MSDLNDIELLERYTRHRSEDAFRELVSRHIDQIYSAALRQLHDSHLAHDATQSAFIALARKAGRLRRETVIAGWLHQAVHFAASHLQRGEARRQYWEQAAATMNEPANPSADPPESLESHLDEALAELGDVDRAAVILRFLRQRSFREVAAALGVSEDAAKKRVVRAIERLRGGLVRRGVTVSAAALATGLAQVPVTAAPPALTANVAALAADIAASATVNGAVGGLMASTKVRLAISAVLLCSTATSIVVWRSRSSGTSIANSNTMTSPIRINLTSVPVPDQAQALNFYTTKLGFVTKIDLPTGGARWLTVVAPEEPDGMQLLLEPMGFAPSRTFQAALDDAGIPVTAFPVKDVRSQYERLRGLDVVFRTPPTVVGTNTIAVLEDTCGNLIQLFQPPGAESTPPIAIRLAQVVVDDQVEAFDFYTRVLGFQPKRDIPVEGGRWLTVVSAAAPDGAELVLEPLGFSPARLYQQALRQAGIPWTSFAVSDIERVHQRLKSGGVKFTQPPTPVGPVSMAVFDDTCGNLIQLVQQ